MSDNGSNKEKNKYGFCDEDYYNEEFDEYGFNQAGIFLKKGHSDILGDDNIDNYHKYAQFCNINKYFDYIIVRLAWFTSDTVKNAMLRYEWKYYSEQKLWVNKTSNVDFEKFVKFLQYNARNQTFISFKEFGTNFHFSP